MKTNAVLQQDVIDELSYEPSIDASNIDVMANDGIVTLTGTVTSYATKMDAQRAAERVCGVKAVADETVVNLLPTHKRTDQEVAQAVLNALSWQVFVPEGAIKVRVDGGFVTLDGTVDFNYQRLAAQNAVSQLTGVRGVTNLVVLKPAVAPSDVKQKIESAFRRGAETDAGRIALKVSGNKVELTGKVSSLAVRTNAEHAAWSAPGVWEVNNHLQIAN